MSGAEQQYDKPKKDTGDLRGVPVPDTLIYQEESGIRLYRDAAIDALSTKVKLREVYIGMAIGGSRVEELMAGFQISATKRGHQIYGFTQAGLLDVLKSFEYHAGVELLSSKSGPETLNKLVRNGYLRTRVPEGEPTVYFPTEKYFKQIGALTE